MPRYHKLGEIPLKRHTAFKDKEATFITKNYLEQSALKECHH